MSRIHLKFSGDMKKFETRFSAEFVKIIEYLAKKEESSISRNAWIYMASLTDKNDKKSLFKSEILKPLNFKVPEDFRKEYKTYAVTHDMSMVELLKHTFEFYKENKDVIQSIAEKLKNIEKTN